MSPVVAPSAERADGVPVGRVGVAKFDVPLTPGTAGKRGVDPGRGVDLLGPARERAGVVRLFNLDGEAQRLFTEEKG